MKAPPPARKRGRDRKAEAEAPAEAEAHGAAEGALVARAEGLAAQGLRRGGEAVEEKAADQEQVVEHRIGRERDVARPRALAP